MITGSVEALVMRRHQFIFEKSAAPLAISSYCCPSRFGILKDLFHSEHRSLTSLRQFLFSEELSSCAQHLTISEEKFEMVPPAREGLADQLAHDDRELLLEFLEGLVGSFLWFASR